MSASSLPLSSNKYDDAIRKAVGAYWADFPDWKYWKAQLYQESRFDPDAESAVGAEGLAQFMPKTWADVIKKMGWSGVSANQADLSIEAGAFYMHRLRTNWSSPRPALDRHQLAEASYNAGTGSMVRAQQLCKGAALYVQIAPCLPQVTGALAQQTLTYVQRIDHWHQALEN